MVNHYDDLLPLWLTGDGVEIPWTDAQIAERCVRELRLEPTG